MSLLLYVAAGFRLPEITSDLSVKLAASVGVPFSGVHLTGFSVVFNNALGPNLPHSLIFKFWPTLDL